MVLVNVIVDLWIRGLIVVLVSFSIAVDGIVDVAVSVNANFPLSDAVVTLYFSCVVLWLCCV